MQAPQLEWKWEGPIEAGSTPLLTFSSNALTEANLTPEPITLTLTNDTFAKTVILTKGVPIESVSKMLGIKT